MKVCGEKMHKFDVGSGLELELEGEGRLLTGGQTLIDFPFSHLPANLRHGRPEKAPGSLGRVPTDAER